MKTHYFVLIFALIANAVANILIKEGMKAKAVSLSQPLETFQQIVLNPFVVSGVFFFGLALAAYSFVLSKIPLSIAYPVMTSAGFLIVLGYSTIKLQESMTPWQIVGVLCILAGIIMVAGNMNG